MEENKNKTAELGTFWKDGAEGNTPLSADNLNAREEKIKEEMDKSGAIVKGEGDNSAQGGADSTAIGDRSFAFGKNAKAGGKGYKLTAFKNNGDGTAICTLQTIEGLLVDYPYSLRVATMICNTGVITSINGLNVTINGVPTDLKWETEDIEDIKNGVVENYLTVVGHPELGDTIIGFNAIALGENVIAQEKDSVGLGKDIKVIGQYGYGVGRDNIVGYSGHAEGRGNKAIGDMCHVEGHESQAIGATSHAEGSKTTSEGDNSHAEGTFSKSIGYSSHAEGYNTEAKKEGAHSEGLETHALGDSSHAEGGATIAEGGNSHSEGAFTKAVGYASHAGGFNTIAKGMAQTAIGLYNAVEEKALFVVGNGTGDKDRKNALVVDEKNNLKIAGQLQDMNGNNMGMTPVYINDKKWYFFSDLTWEDNAGYCNFIGKENGYVTFKGQKIRVIFIGEDGLEYFGDLEILDGYPSGINKYVTME